MLNGIDCLLDLCIVNEEERVKWKYCISKYCNAMILLHKKLDLTNDEIKQFQQHVEELYVTWLALLLTGHHKLYSYAWGRAHC